MTDTAPDSRRVRKGYADIDPGEIHYLERSGTRTPIVFLHQTASAADTYDRVLADPRLPGRLIALDTPGFGGSYDPPGWPSMRRYAEILVQALDSLGVKDFHLFGHHTGACLGAEMAVRWPARVRSLMMLGPVLMTAQERDQFRAGFKEPFAPVEDGSHLLKNWNYARANNPDCDLEIVHREVSCMIRAWKGRAQAYTAVSRQDGHRMLARVKCPILLLSSKTDYFYDQFHRAAELRPDAAVAMVRGGNFAPMTGAASVAGAVAKFVETFRG